MSNPFEDNNGMQDNNQSSDPWSDPSVQNTQNEPPPTSGLPMYSDNAYEDNNTTSNVVQDTVVNVGTDTTKQVVSQQTNEMKTDYEQQSQYQKDHNPPPAPPAWIERCMNWFPLRWFAFFGGFLVTLFALLDIILSTGNTSFIGYFVYFYLFFFGWVIMFTESPSFRLTRSGQIGIYFWFRILSRLWGRAWFFLFVSLLCMGELDGNNVNFSAFAGFYLVVMSIITWVVSRASAKKYQRIYIYISAGFEGEERDKRFVEKFKELDGDQDGFLGSSDIVKLALEAGRELANSERHAIQTFLDESCNGKVSLDDFCKQYKTFNMKQRFL